MQENDLEVIARRGFAGSAAVAAFRLRRYRQRSGRCQVGAAAAPESSPLLGVRYRHHGRWRFCRGRRRRAHGRPAGSHRRRCQSGTDSAMLPGSGRIGRALVPAKRIDADLAQGRGGASHQSVARQSGADQLRPGRARRVGERAEFCDRALRQRRQPDLRRRRNQLLVRRFTPGCLRRI